MTEYKKHLSWQEYLQMHYLYTGTKYLKTASPNWAEIEKVEEKVLNFTPGLLGAWRPAVIRVNNKTSISSL